MKPELNLAWNPGQTLTIPSALMLASLRIHSQYWTENPRAESALGLVATALFGTTAVLA